jgi:hypothetical protein
MAKYFTDVDDIVPGKEIQSSEDLQNYLLEHSYRDGMTPPADEKVLYYNGIPIGSRGNIIAINGKAKSRKSVIASAIMSSCFTQDEAGFLGFTARFTEDPKVLNFDTEQGLGHWIEGSRRVVVDAGLDEKPKGFYSHHTRDCEVDKRIALLEFALDLYKPDICVVDGVTDLVFDLNNQEEATKIGGRLMTWSVKYNCLIVAIIHITKGTGYMTGAVGTYLEKKCQTALKCEKDEKDDAVSWVTCQYARDKGFPMFSIHYDEVDGHYVRGEASEEMRSSVGPAQASEELKTQLLKQLFAISGTYINTYSFNNGITRAGGLAGIPKMTPKDAKLWAKYFFENQLIVTDPDGNILRSETVRAYKAASPELNFAPPLEDHSTDDLPF